MEDIQVKRKVYALRLLRKHLCSVTLKDTARNYLIMVEETMTAKIDTMAIQVKLA